MRYPAGLERVAIFSCVLTGLWAIAAAVWVSAGHPVRADNPESRVVSIGGSITEIVYALGEDHRLVARDTTSSYPPAATTLPDVGYMRALSPEGVLSVNPDMILTEDGAGPPEAISILEAAQIPFVVVPDGFDRAAVVAKSRAVGDALDVAPTAELLADQVDADLRAAEAKAANYTGDAKRVMFILSAQSGRILTSGTGTAADGIIRMAGGQNAITEFEGYKPIPAEAITAAAPDVVLMMDRGGDHAIKDDDLFAMPAMQTTPAAETRAIVRMNGLFLLGFGPRTADAVTELNRHLYGG